MTMTITMNEMVTMAYALVDADAAVDAAESALKVAKARARVLREETIPSAMHELGLDKIRLESGEEISVKQDVYASIANGDKQSAFRWLDKNGHGGLIKTEIKVPYGRGESRIALELFEELRARSLAPTMDESVHPQTLKAFLREQLAAGVNVPLDLFGANPVWTTKITTKR